MGWAHRKMDAFDVVDPHCRDQVLDQAASNALMLISGVDVDMKMGGISVPETSKEKIGFLPSVEFRIEFLEQREAFLFHRLGKMLLVERSENVADDLALECRDEAMIRLLVEVIIGIEKIKDFRLGKELGIIAGGQADPPNRRKVGDGGRPNQDGRHNGDLLNSLSVSSK